MVVIKVKKLTPTTEFALPITDEFDADCARYEDYGTVDSVDPKVVMRWAPTVILL